MSHTSYTTHVQHCNHHTAPFCFTLSDVLILVIRSFKDRKQRHHPATFLLKARSQPHNQQQLHQRLNRACHRLPHPLLQAFLVRSILSLRNITNTPPTRTCTRTRTRTHTPRHAPSHGGMLHCASMIQAPTTTCTRILAHHSRAHSHTHTHKL